MIFATSAIAVLGGLIMFFVVPDEPAMSSGARLAPGAMGQIFRSRAFRASAFGYFGHMWELYAFWAFVPVALAAHVGSGAAGGIDIALWAFVVIGVGAVGCAWGGVLTGRFGSARVAFTQLAISGACCALSPLFFSAPTTVFLLFLVVWGITVAGDSPQFSTLNARNAPEHLVGSALTVVNCIGFSITIVSIQLLGWMHLLLDTRWIFLFLVLGPVAGLVAMKPLLRERAPLD